MAKAEAAPLTVENDFAPFATGAGANVMPLTTYLGSPQLANGVATGIADPTLYNRSIRQATFVAAAMATFSVNGSGQPALDDGNLTEFVTNFTHAIAVSGGVPAFASNADALAGVITNQIIAPSSLNYVLAQSCLLLTGGSISGAVTVHGTLSALGGLTANGLNVTGGPVTLPAASVAGAAIVGGLTNAQHANMAAGTVKANTTAGAAPPADIPYAALLTAMGITPVTRAHYQGNAASGTNSPETLAANAWTTRLLNWANALNNIAGATSPSGNQVSLPAGTYKVVARSTMTATGPSTGFRGNVRVRDVTHGATLAIGVNAGMPGSSGEEGSVVMSAQSLFTLAATSTVEVDTYSLTYGANGGNAIGSGELEVWTDVLFEKIA
jgi:hypothetical protein